MSDSSDDTVVPHLMLGRDVDRTIPTECVEAEFSFRYGEGAGPSWKSKPGPFQDKAVNRGGQGKQARGGPGRLFRYAEMWLRGAAGADG